MLFLLLLLHLILLINTRFTLWPEMVVYPYLLNNGFLLYQDNINPYPPALTYFLSIFTKFFGYYPLPFQILTWSAILFSDLLIYLFTKKTFKKNFYAFASVLFFTVVSIPFGVNGLWFDLIQTPFILTSFYYFSEFLKKAKKTKLLLFSLLFLIVATLIKQQTLWLFLGYLIILLVKFKPKELIKFKELYLSIFVFIIAILLQMIFFNSKGLLEDFVFLTIYFPFFKASSMPGYILLPTLRQIIPLISIYLIFLPLIFKRRSEVIFISLISLTFAYPRFDYFHLIPALAILFLGFTENLKAFMKSGVQIRALSLIAVIFLSIFTTRYILKNRTWEVRFFERDIYSAGVFISKITLPDDPIYIQNGPDQILPIAGRLPTKPWVDEFPWYLEIARTQEKILEGLTKQKPKYTIFKPYDNQDKYEIGSYRPQKLADFLDAHYKNHFQISDTLVKSYK